MEPSWLGLDDFFSASSRLRSRRSRISLHSSDERSRYGVDAIKIDFGPRNLDLDFDTSALRSSFFRDFDSFPRKTGSKLKSVECSAKKPKEQKASVVESAKTETEVEGGRESRLKLQQTLEENTKLQTVIADLTQVNKRWQKYNNERQIYVQKLLNTIQDQQEQINHIGERSFTSCAAAGQSSATNSSNDTETERLRNVEQKLKEKISILEFQVKAHRDDWEAELNEKKQALKDKEVVERKVAELLAQMQVLSSPADRCEGRVELYCQTCGHISEFDHSPPSRSKMYRTAVHLPCSPSRHSSSTSISTTGDELVLDSRGLRHSGSRLEGDDKDSAKIWNIKPDETSYSRSSTVPLVSGSPVQSAPGSVATTTHSSASSLGDKTFQFGCNPVTVKSFMQIPIAKSSSVPEGSASKFSEVPRMSLDCFKYSKCVPPVTVVNSAEQYEGTETLSAENVICLRCGEVFPPDMHLKFLDHFPKCQSIRNNKTVSNDNVHRV